MRGVALVPLLVAASVVVTGCLQPPVPRRAPNSPTAPTTVAPTTATTPPTTTPTTAPAPSPGAMPTFSNSGVTQPVVGSITAGQFLETGTCDHQEVTGDVHLEDWSGTAAAGAGRTFTAVQCAFDEQVFLLFDGFYGTARYPTIRFDHVSIPKGTILLGGMKGTISNSAIGGGFWSPCPNCTNTEWGTVRAMPLAVTNTLLYSLPPSSPDGYHYEALHVMGSSTGMSFDNVRFTIRGPYNGTQTGAILFDANQAVFTDVYLDFDGTPAASYYTAYIGEEGAGANVSVNGCRVEMGMAWYVYPGGTGNHDSTAASWTGCKDWTSGISLSL